MSKYTQRVSNLPFEFSNKLVTPWGGLRYIQEFMEYCGFRQKLRELEFHKPGSGAGAKHFEYKEGSTKTRLASSIFKFYNLNI